MKRKLLNKQAPTKLNKGRIYCFIYRSEDESLSEENIKHLFKNNDVVGYVDLGKKSAEIIYKNKISEKITLTNTLQLVDLSLAINQLTSEERVNFLLIKSVNYILQHNEYYATVKFIKYLIENLKNKGITCVLVAEDCESTTRLVAAIASEIDKYWLMDSLLK